MAVEESIKPAVDDSDSDDEPLVFRRTSNSIVYKKTEEVKKSSSNIGQPSNTQKSKVLRDSDEEPLVFRRKNNSTVSNKNQLAPEVEKSSSTNGQVANTQKSKVVPSAITSPPSRSPLASPKPAASSSKASTVNPSTEVHSKVSASSNDQSRKQNALDTQKSKVVLSTIPRRPSSSLLTSPKSTASSSKEPLVKPSTEVHSKVSASSNDQSKKQNACLEAVKKEIKQKDSDSEDSEDAKPLSSRVKVFSNNNNKRLSEDSDDETPLSSKFAITSNPGTSGIKRNDYEDKKLLPSKTQQNGSASKQQTSSSLLNKRPLDKVNSSDKFSGKKTKVLDTRTEVKSKQAEVKAEDDDKVTMSQRMKKQGSSDNKLSSTNKVKAEDDDHITMAQRMKKQASSVNRSSSTTKTITKSVPPVSKKIMKKSKKIIKSSKYTKVVKQSPNSGDGQKWKTLEHCGVIFPPPYEPHGVKMLFKGKPVDLTPDQEEVATMYAVMRDTEYYTKPIFQENFWTDWRKKLGKNHIIQNLKDCDFTPIYEWHQQVKEAKKQMSSEEKKALKEEKAEQEEKYMWAVVDGVREKVGNFRVEPPGLFRGRGEHPKMGKLKRRIFPRDITINIGKDAPIPECPIPGERWKEVKHDDTVTWLAFWNDPINTKEFKYVFLAPSSALKGQSDKEKYEKARKLKDYIEGIREKYKKDFTSGILSTKQIAVATYLIDKLALRAGNEKDDDEADTVGCCTLKVGNVECVEDNKLKFDFLGKDSIQYVNTVEVESLVYKAIKQFQKGKKESDDLFDELDTSKLNAHLKTLMPGLSAKVFRTYNASITLDDQLNEKIEAGSDVAQKSALYQVANKKVAIICNHQRAVSKSHTNTISRLTGKIEELKGVIKELKIDLDRAKKGKTPLKDADGKQKRTLAPELIAKKIAQTEARIEKMDLEMQTREDLKTVALGTSKINYLDPRITVAWCKRLEVPIEKIFNKSLIAKFSWAMDVEPDFRF